MFDTMCVTSMRVPLWIKRAIGHPYVTDLVGRIRRRGPFTTGEKVVFVIAFAAAYVFGIRWNRGMADFAVNYRAGARILHGDTLYQAADGHYMFKYFPFAALIYAPFSVLPIELAMVLWFLLSLAAFFVMFRMVEALVVATAAGGPGGAVQRRVRYAVLIAGAILAKYILHELRLGQINVFVTLVMLAAFSTLLRWRPDTGELAAGLLAGIAVAIKPYAVLLLLYFLVTLRWRALLAAAAALATALIVPSLFYGVGGNLGELQQWGASLTESTPSLLTNVDNVSVLAFFTKWLGDSHRAVRPGFAVLGTLAVVTLAAILLGWRRRNAVLFDGGLLLMLIPLISPLGWDYTFLMSLLGVTLIVTYRAVYPRRVWFVLTANFAIIALALYDTMGRVVYGAFMRWSVTTINFIIVVCALAYLRFRRVC
jgi:hypothetical protein